MTRLHPTRTVEFWLTLAAVGVLYKLLLSSVLVDDALRYIDELHQGTFNWDLGHVWMEPLALLLYKGPLQALSATHALEAVNVAAVALGAAVFFQTLRGLGHNVARAAVATALVVCSFNLLVLGPTSHIKLMVFPALALSLKYAIWWEARSAGGEVGIRDAVASGIWLGVGCNLLISVLPISFFVGVFMLLRGRQAGASWARAWTVALGYAAGLIATGALLLIAAFATAKLTGTTTAGGLSQFLFGGIQEKQALHTGYVSWKEIPFRFVFSSIFNFAFLPSLGGLGRAWLAGFISDLRPVIGALVWQLALAALSFSCLLAILWHGATSWRSRTGTLTLALGFFLGSAAFSAYYNLNDPEHWFQFTLPLVLMAVQARRPWLDKLAFGLWLPILVVVNFGLYGVPKALFDVDAKRLALHEALGSQGLLVGYGAYPGEPDTSLLYLGDPTTRAERERLAVRRFNIDHAFERGAQANVDRTLQMLDEAIEQTHSRGGRVLVVRALDDSDWRGPMSHLAFFGLGQKRIREHLQQREVISEPFDIAGFRVWELKARAPG